MSVHLRTARHCVSTANAEPVFTSNAFLFYIGKGFERIHFIWDKTNTFYILKASLNSRKKPTIPQLLYKGYKYVTELPNNFHFTLNSYLAYNQIRN